VTSRAVELLVELVAAGRVRKKPGARKGVGD
jgi:hypothetical protein